MRITFDPAKRERVLRERGLDFRQAKEVFDGPHLTRPDEMTVKSKTSRRTWRDPDDAPQITDKWIAEANLYHGKKLVRRGRPAGSGQKTQTTVRISKDVLEFFRATGPGWQTRLDNALKRYVASQRR